MSFDLEGARKAGYTDTEIAQGLAKRWNFDLEGAKSAGYTDGQIIAKLMERTATLAPASAIPTAPTAAQAAQGSRAPVAPAGAAVTDTRNASFGQRAAGVGEAALTLATGATGGMVGMVGGTAGATAAAILNGSFGSKEAADMIEQAAAQGAQALTYEPRGAVGQEIVGAIGQAAQGLAPLAGLSPQMAGMAAGARPVAGAARTGAAAVLDKAQTAVPAAVRQVPERMAQVMGRTEPTPTRGTMGSVGAAGTDMAAMRTATAENMPIPVKLTRGQSTRDFEQLRFEKETAKDPARGAALRDRGEEQNAAILGNFDAWIDATGAQAPDVVATGRAVNSALVSRAARDKAAVRVAYKEAEKAGEMASPVKVDGIAQALDASRSAESTAPVLVAARREIVRLGGAIEGPDGALLPGEMTLNNAEQLRKFVNKVTGIDPTNQKFAADIKTAIDAATEGAGGQAYKKARALRTQYAQTYENHAIVSDLLRNRRAMSDPKVAIEKVFQRTVLQGSADDLTFLRRVLQTGGDNGQQAWKDLQGSTLQHIRDQATRGVSTDQRGNAVISPAGLDRAIKQLDANGRLEIVLGKQGAQQLRDISDIAKFVNTAPPGAINTSNTASVLLAAMAETGANGAMFGIPLPVISGLRVATTYVKDRQIQQRIVRALNNEAERQRAKPKPAPSPQSVTLQ